jgi:hypothetical protein
MHARLQTIRSLPVVDDPGPVREKVIEVIAGHPGFAGVFLMEQLGGPGSTGLSLWETEEDARLAPERSAAVRGPRPVTLETDQVYEVQHTWSGPDAGRPPRAAVVLYFDGPMAPPVIEASIRGGRERVLPVISKVPGIVGGFQLWQPEDRALTIVNLAVSLDALDDAARAVNSTTLLPGEDPALLPGPDRAVVHLVAAHLSAKETPA